MKKVEKSGKIAKIEKVRKIKNKIDHFKKQVFFGSKCIKNLKIKLFIKNSKFQKVQKSQKSSGNSKTKIIFKNTAYSNRSTPLGTQKRPFSDKIEKIIKN